MNFSVKYAERVIAASFQAPEIPSIDFEPFLFFIWRNQRQVGLHQYWYMKRPWMEKLVTGNKSLAARPII